MVLRKFDIAYTAQVNVPTLNLSMYPEPGELWLILRGYGFSSSATAWRAMILKDDGTILGYLKNAVSAANQYKWLHILADSDASVSVFQPLSYLACVVSGERIVLNTGLVAGDVVRMQIIADVVPYEVGALRTR